MSYRLFELVSRGRYHYSIFPPFYRSLWSVTWLLRGEPRFEPEFSGCYLIPLYPDIACEVHAKWVLGGARDGESKTSDRSNRWLLSITVYSEELSQKPACHPLPSGGLQVQHTTPKFALDFSILKKKSL